MGITDRNFEKAIGSMEAASIRGKMGIKEGNRFIQNTWNQVNAGHNFRKCGFD